jgi:hypothetical protein
VRRQDFPVATPAIVASVGAACIFHDPAGEARCRWQRALGHAALPLACRQFPRVSLVDPRGISVTLSHYCPTAAQLLDDDRPAEIVRRGGHPGDTGGPGDAGHLGDADHPGDAGGPGQAGLGAAGFATRVEDAGLDARDDLPPLLRPNMLMDWEAWSAWESASVALIERAPDTATALSRLGAVVEQARRWTPAEGPLVAWIAAAFARDAARDTRSPDPGEHLETVLAAVPETWRPGRGSLGGEPPTSRARRRLLIAHAFASWTGQLGQGIRTWLRSLEAADALIEAGLGVRETDLLLRHLADPAELARRWSDAERD